MSLKGKIIIISVLLITILNGLFVGAVLNGKDPFTFFSRAAVGAAFTLDTELTPVAINQGFTVTLNAIPTDGAHISGTHVEPTYNKDICAVHEVVMNDSYFPVSLEDMIHDTDEPRITFTRGVSPSSPQGDAGIVATLTVSGLKEGECTFSFDTEKSRATVTEVEDNYAPTTFTGTSRTISANAPTPLPNVTPTTEPQPSPTDIPLPSITPGTEGPIEISLENVHLQCAINPTTTSVQAIGALDHPSLDEPILRSFYMTFDGESRWNGNVFFDVPTTSTGTEITSGFVFNVKAIPSFLSKTLCDTNPSEDVPGGYVCGKNRLTISESTPTVIDMTNLVLLSGDIANFDDKLNALDVSKMIEVISSAETEQTQGFAPVVPATDVDMDGFSNARDYSCIQFSARNKPGDYSEQYIDLYRKIINVPGQ